MDTIRKKVIKGGNTTCSDVCKQETIDRKFNHPQCVAAYTKGNHKSEAKGAKWKFKGWNLTADCAFWGCDDVWPWTAEHSIDPSMMRRMDCCTKPYYEHARHMGNNNTEDANYQTQICYCGNPDINYRNPNHPRFNDKYKECATNPTKEVGDPMHEYIKI